MNSTDNIEDSEKFLKELWKSKAEEKLQFLEDELKRTINEHLSMLQKEFTDYIDVPELSNGKLIDTAKLPEKLFKSRDSLLTELLKISHVKCIYNIFIATFILLFLQTIINDFLETGRLSMDFDLILWAFGKPHMTITIWACMLWTSMCVFPLFSLWASSRHEMNIKIWDTSWLFLYIFYVGSFIYYPVKELFNVDLPPASSFIILCEQVHAFIRSKITVVLKCENNEYDVDFSRFLYFLFAPTLVYRDNYPRTSKTNWNYVVFNLVEVAACIFYTNFLFVHFCIPAFRQFGQKPFIWHDFIRSVFTCTLPGTICLLCAFYAILHSWLNAFAEMLRFSDRMFYKDWWNSTNYAAFYRTWNVVVHDWLYTYVYKDLCELNIRFGRIWATLGVFIISAAFHEYILAFSFRFFYPVLLFLFGGIGACLSFLRARHRHWNVFMWLSLFIGTGLLLSLYSQEIYAHKNCPPYEILVFHVLGNVFFWNTTSPQ